MQRKSSKKLHLNKYPRLKSAKKNNINSLMKAALLTKLMMIRRAALLPKRKQTSLSLWWMQRMPRLFWSGTMLTALPANLIRKVRAMTTITSMSWESRQRWKYCRSNLQPRSRVMKVLRKFLLITMAKIWTK